MATNLFQLTIDTQKHPVIFPIPTTNHYQTIQLISSLSAKSAYALDSEMKLVECSPKSSTQLRFFHTPKKVKIDLDKVVIFQSRKTELLHTDEYINYKDKDIINLASQWMAEHELHTANEIVQTFYQKTLQYLNYGNPINGLYKYTQALRNRTTDCGGFATFLASLLETQGIVCRLVVGYLYKQGFSYTLKSKILPKSFDDISMHAWLEVQTEQGSWFPVDPSVEWKRLRGLSARKGGFGDIPADRLVVSFGHNHTLRFLNQKYTFPIFQHPEALQ